MKSLKENINESTTNESEINEGRYVDWTVFNYSVNNAGGNIKKTYFKSDKDADFMCIDLISNQIYFYTADDVQYVASEKGWSENLVDEICNYLSVGETHTYNTNEGPIVFVAI